MAGIRLIKRRIKSASNIAQITKAMQMVAASKMKKAQEAALFGKPYAEKIYQAVSELTKICDTSYHQLLTKENPAGKILIILIATNKGLCGSINTNLFRRLITWFPQKDDCEFLTIGSKGAGFVLRYGFSLKADFSHVPFSQHIPAVIDLVIDGYLKGKYRQIQVIYNSFLNALNIIPDKRLLLPMAKILADSQEKILLPEEFLIEPNPRQLLNALLPHYLETIVRTAIIQAEASEHSSRMLAMKSATDNALSLSDELTLIYNKLRQEQITYEIADITRAQLSLTN